MPFRLASLTITFCLLLPGLAAAHGSNSKSSRSSSSSLPRVTMLSAQRHYKAEIANSSYSLASSVAMIVRRNHLRLSMQPTRKGLVAYQLIGQQKHRLPRGSMEMSRGMVDGWRINLYRDNKLIQKRRIAWCPDGTAPLNAGRFNNDPLPGGCGSPSTQKIVTGVDRNWMATLQQLLEVYSGSPDNGGEQPTFDPSVSSSGLADGVALSDGYPMIEENGRYRLELIFDPQRIFRLSSDSRRRVSFTFDIDAVPTDVAEETTSAPATLSRRRGILPDLRALKPTGISLIAAEGKIDANLLSFNSVVWNASKGSLIVRGRRSTLRGKTMPAYQTLIDNEARPAGTFPIGKLIWDARDGHSHWHYNGLASYLLVNKQGKVVAKSGKVGFCFVNTDPINSDYFHPKAYRLRRDMSGNLGCGNRFSLSALMQLDGGWGDQYVQSLPGQAIDISKVKNGGYQLQVRVNSGHRAKIRESNYQNNLASRRITLSGSGPDRQVEVAPWYLDPMLTEEPQLSAPWPH